jgi:hypothetical protein
MGGSSDSNVAGEPFSRRTDSIAGAISRSFARAHGLLTITGMRDLYRLSGRLAVGAVVGLVVRASVVVALVALAG